MPTAAPAAPTYNINQIQGYDQTQLAQLFSQLSPEGSKTGWDSGPDTAWMTNNWTDPGTGAPVEQRFIPGTNYHLVDSGGQYSLDQMQSGGWNTQFFEMVAPYLFAGAGEVAGLYDAAGTAGGEAGAAGAGMSSSDAAALYGDAGYTGAAGAGAGVGAGGIDWAGGLGGAGLDTGATTSAGASVLADNLAAGGSGSADFATAMSDSGFGGTDATAAAGVDSGFPGLSSSDASSLYSNTGYGGSSSPWDSVSSWWDKYKPYGSVKNAQGWLRGLSSLYGLQQSRQNQKAARAPNPASLTSMPGYQAGLEAVQRSMAAQGYQGSGNMMAALQKYGGDAYAQQWQNQIASAQAQQGGMMGSLSSLGLLSSALGMFGG